MTTTTVSNYATLLAALKTSKGGDTIALAPGAYPMQTILNVNPQGGVVTITSSDPTQKAILQGLKVATCSNLVFTGLELTTIAANGQPVDPYFAFRVSGLRTMTSTAIQPSPLGARPAASMSMVAKPLLSATASTT
jgi:hypothetical protein